MVKTAGNQMKTVAVTISRSKACIWMAVLSIFTKLHWMHGALLKVCVLNFYYSTYMWGGASTLWCISAELYNLCSFCNKHSALCYLKCIQIIIQLSVSRFSYSIIFIHWAHNLFSLYSCEMKWIELKLRTWAWAHAVVNDTSEARFGRNYRRHPLADETRRGERTKCNGNKQLCRSSYTFCSPPRLPTNFRWLFVLHRICFHSVKSLIHFAWQQNTEWIELNASHNMKTNKRIQHTNSASCRKSVAHRIPGFPRKILFGSFLTTVECRALCCRCFLSSVASYLVIFDCYSLLNGFSLTEVLSVKLVTLHTQMLLCCLHKPEERKQNTLNVTR